MQYNQRIRQIREEKGLTQQKVADILHIGQRTYCHSFVTDGRIQYLDDCTHELRGQTIDLPDIKKEFEV